MLNMTVHGRLGRDTELRYLDDGSCVADMAIGCNYGRKGDDGKTPTQWVKATLWGKQAEKLSEYLTKGKGVVVVLSDVHVVTYPNRDGGTGVSLEGRMQSVEFTGAGPREERQEPAQRAAAPAPAPRPPAPAPASASRPSVGFDDMDDDIPF